MGLRSWLSKAFGPSGGKEGERESAAELARREIGRFQRARADGKATLLFICSGNSVRSQFAEALVTHHLGDRYEAFSAGILQIPVVPQAVKAMSEIGVDISDKVPKPIDLFQDCRFDRVIILCSDADQFCPVFLNCERRECMPFMDPLTSYGAAAVSLTLFRKLRDDLKAHLIPHLQKS